MSAHTTQEPQRTDSSRADAEWKADPGLGNVIHDGGPGSEVDRSGKAAPAPEGDFNDSTHSGGGSNPIKGSNGDGKGPLDPADPESKNKGEQARN